jgi:predicted translin family RNA/ssDNA-binding protein
VLEEYVEAKLFYTWLHGNAELPLEKPTGILLMPQDFSIPLQMDEYLGGLCDLTGEIGRYAVQRGTARDFDGVKQCLATNTAIYLAIQTMERFPSGIGKKMDQLRQSVEKLERMTYELSLSEATGRKITTIDQ